ncbi:MAG: KEOPS complex kinase/ATPase Bud32 [Candidatus Nanoarchaeia archaeon]
MKQLLAQGAEAKTYRQGDLVFKERFVKTYRHKQVDDALRSLRTKRECTVLQKLADAAIAVPQVHVSKEDFVVVMDYIDAPRLRDELLNYPSEFSLISLAGTLLAKMHNLGIIHGDYTTSNILVRSKHPADIVLIDFGLSFFSTKIEDMAVDIHLAFQAFQSTHYTHAQEYERIFLDSYTNNSTQSEDIFQRLKTVRLRGRNKH